MNFFNLVPKIEVALDLFVTDRVYKCREDELYRTDSASIELVNSTSRRHKRTPSFLSAPRQARAAGSGRDSLTARVLKLDFEGFLWLFADTASG
jgi:hypothetical protein